MSKTTDGSVERKKDTNCPVPLREGTHFRGPSRRAGESMPPPAPGFDLNACAQVFTTSPYSSQSCAASLCLRSSQRRQHMCCAFLKKPFPENIYIIHSLKQSWKWNIDPWKTIVRPLSFHDCLRYTMFALVAVVPETPNIMKSACPGESEQTCRRLGELFSNTKHLLGYQHILLCSADCRARRLIEILVYNIFNKPRHGTLDMTRLSQNVPLYK